MEKTPKRSLLIQCRAGSLSLKSCGVSGTNSNVATSTVVGNISIIC